MEHFRPIPEGEHKPKSPEAGAGPLGVSPPGPEHVPQGGGSKSPERQPLPSASDILERRAQLYESRVRDLHLRHHESKHTREYLDLYREHRENVEQLGDEAARLYAEWSDHDRLIFDLYTTSKNWNLGFSPQQTQQFIANIAPMSDEEIAEELRNAREAAERKAARYKKKVESERRNRNLPPEERLQRYMEEFNKLQESVRQLHSLLPEEQRKRDKEKQREYQRNYRKRRKEERRLQAEQQKPTQVFRPPTEA